MKIKQTITALTLLITVGCQQKQPLSPEEERITKILPPNHTNIKPLGNNWFTYEMEINGKKQAFLGRYTLIDSAGRMTLTSNTPIDPK